MCVRGIGTAPALIRDTHTHFESVMEVSERAECVSKVIESLLLLLLLFGQNALRSLISIYDSFSRPNTVKAEKIGWSVPRQELRALCAAH